MHSLYWTLTVAVGLYVSNLWLSFRRLVEKVNHQVGYHVLFSTTNPFFTALRGIPGINNGYHFAWRSKYNIFQGAGSDAVTFVSAWPSPEVAVHLADPAAIKEVSLSRQRFPKPVGVARKLLGVFGDNLAVVEGDEWKRHRKINVPAFTTRNNHLVWDETTRFVQEAFSDWGDSPEVSINHAVSLTDKIALLVLGSASFGQHVSWKESAHVPEGHRMSFQMSLELVSKNILLSLLIPSWAMGLTARFKTIRAATLEVKQYMQEMIDQRKSGKVFGEGRADLFSTLLTANAHTDSPADSLSDSELIGTIFLMLIAGHETSGHTLAFALGILALEPEEQSKLYEHVQTVLPDGRTPTFEDFPSLNYTLAVFYETLRLFPPVNIIPKSTVEDQVLSVPRAYMKGEDCDEQQRFVVAIPKDSTVFMNLTGLHYNPRYWPDPYAFKPSRFLEEYNKDAFVAFSAGARSCVGRRFAETEAVAILTMIVSRYEILVDEDKFPTIPGESKLERRERLLVTKPGITMAPLKVPLKFRKRV